MRVQLLEEEVKAFTCNSTQNYGKVRQDGEGRGGQGRSRSVRVQLSEEVKAFICNSTQKVRQDGGGRGGKGRSGSGRVQLLEEVRAFIRNSTQNYGKVGHWWGGWGRREKAEQGRSTQDYEGGFLAVPSRGVLIP